MKTITIQEETKIPQKDGSTIILEVGDKIRVNENYKKMKESIRQDFRNFVQGEFNNFIDKIMKDSGDDELSAIREALDVLGEDLEYLIGGSVYISWGE